MGSKYIDMTGDHIISIGSKIGAAGDITLDGAHGVVVKDGENFSVIREQNEKMKAGAFATWNGKRLSASAGFEATYGKNKNGRVLITPEKNILVTNGNIHIKSLEGNVFLQGDFGAKENIGVLAEKGKIYVKDSKSEIHTDSESVNARIELALGINLGGIKDTFKSYRDYLKAIKEIGNVGKLLSFIREVASGKDIFESMEGKEDTINAINTYLKGPNSGGVSTGIGIGLDIENGKSVTRSIENIVTNIRTGGDTILKAKELDFYGTSLRSDGDVILDASKINLQASKNTYISKRKGIVINGKYGTDGYGGNVNISRSNIESIVYNNTQIISGGTVYSKPYELIIRGGNILGKYTDIETKNLIIESLQDTEKTKQIGIGLGLIGGKGVEKYTNSISTGVNTGNVDNKWVGTQSSIIGTKGIKMRSDKTYIKGGLIANIDEKGVDKGNLIANLGKLTIEDINDKNKILNVGINTSISQRERDPNVIVNLKDEKGNSIKKEDRLGTNYDISFSGGKRE